MTRRCGDALRSADARVDRQPLTTLRWMERYDTMTHRERMIRTVRFQEVDRLPLRHAYGLMPGVLEDWYAEGLPSSVKTERDIYEYFGFPARLPPLPLNVGFDPPFETRVIEENEEYRITTDGMGRATKVAKKYATIALPMEYPVRDDATWQDYRRRLAFAADGSARISDASRPRTKPRDISTASGRWGSTGFRAILWGPNSSASPTTSDLNWSKRSWKHGVASSSRC